MSNNKVAESARNFCIFSYISFTIFLENPPLFGKFIGKLKFRNYRGSIVISSVSNGIKRTIEI